MSGALRLLLPLALVVLLPPAFLPAFAQPKCSLTDAQIADINFGEDDSVKSACELRPPSGSVSCGDCTCALSTTFLSQLGKVGVDVVQLLGQTTPNGSNALADLLESCGDQLNMRVLVTAGLSTAAATQVQSCNVTTIPDSCAQALLQQAGLVSGSLPGANPPPAGSTPTPAGTTSPPATMSLPPSGFNSPPGAAPVPSSASSFWSSLSEAVLRWVVPAVGAVLVHLTLAF